MAKKKAKKVSTTTPKVKAPVEEVVKAPVVSGISAMMGSCREVSPAMMTKKERIAHNKRLTK